MPKNFPLTRRSILGAAVAATTLPLHAVGTVRGYAPEASPVPTDTFDDQLLALLSECDSIFGIQIVDASGQVVFEHNADLPFVSASLYKLVLIAECLLRIERGDLTLEDSIEIRDEFFIAENGDDSYFDYAAIGYAASVEELLYSAGSYSSNTGAQALFSLTSVQDLDRLAVQLGLTNTFYRLISQEVADLYVADPDSSPVRDHARSVRFIQSFAADGTVNVTTPRDIRRLFELLRDDKLGSAVTSWRFKQILSAKVINDRLPALLPESVDVVHKTGNLPGVLHDAGIIETPVGSVVVVVLAQAATELDATLSIEQRIGLAAYGIGSRLDRAR